ncbi:MAG: hypothetical protein SGILL_010100 [Bacillariaceae sp.]
MPFKDHDEDAVKAAALPERSGSSSSIRLDSLPIVEAEEDDDGSSAMESLLIVAAEDVVLLDEESVRLGRYEPAEDAAIRPSLISVSYFKETHDIPMGISFQSINGVLQISRINPSGPLADSPLRKGDTIVAIDNHRNCSRWSSSQAVRYLKNCGGHFTMLFSNPLGDPNLHEAVVYKANESEKVGVVFENDHEQRLRIKKLTSSGLISKLCALEEGDYVTFINGSASHLVDADTAKIMVRSTPILVSIQAKPTKSGEAVSIRNAHELSHRGYLSYNITPTVDATANESILSHSTTANASSSIVSNNPSKPNMMLSQTIVQPSPADFEMFLEEEGIQPRFVFVQCNKPSIDTPLGISFISTPGQLQISSISGTGVLWASPLRKGFDVLALDGQVVTKWSTTQAAQHIRQRPSTVSIMARNPNGRCSYVVAQVTKPTPRSKIGMSFKNFEDGRLKVGRIFPHSLFAGSILNEDNEILNINGVPAYGLTASEAVAIVEHATDTVTLLAKTDPASAIVLASLGADQAPIVVPMNISATDAAVAQYEEERERSNACNPAVCIAVCVCVLVMFFVIAAVGPADGNY